MKSLAIDAHCHLVDQRFSDSLEIVKQAHAMGIELLMMGGVDPRDWEAQLKLAQKSHGVLPVLGLHPYRVAQLRNEELRSAWEQLVALCPYAFAIGETGVDARSEFAGQKERQLEYFKKHINLAIQENKVLVTHIVRAHNESLSVLKDSKLTRPVIVHAFNSSPEVAQQYTDQGFYLSVGGAVTFQKNKKLRSAVQHMPQEQLLLESDSPDQGPCNWNEELNRPESIFVVAESIASLWGESGEFVIQQTTQNFKNLFSQELRKLSR